MKRLVSVSFILAIIVLAASLPLFAQATKGKDVSYVGWIVDEWCGAKNANADGKTCALECHQKGAKLVLYVPESKTTVVLDDQEKAAKNVGVEVRVKGTMDGDTLKVSSIETAKKS